MVVVGLAARFFERNTLAYSERYSPIPDTRYTLTFLIGAIKF